MPVVSNFIAISLFLNELNLSLVQEDKIKRTVNLQTIHSSKPNFFIIFYKREKLDSDFVFFSQTSVKNWVTMATA